MKFDVEEARKHFPFFRKNAFIYLDTAATAHKPDCVIETISRFYGEEYSTVNRAAYQLCAANTHQFHLARETVATFLNAKSAEEIIFTKGTTESINLVASSFSKAFLEKGDEIILSVSEHHSNLVPWQQIAKEKELIIHYIPIDSTGALLLEAYEKLLSERTKIVSIAHISNTTGAIHPIETIISRAHQFGAKVLIDGAQAAPHLLIDVQRLNCDFYAFSGHKLYGPTGIGVLYGKKSLLDLMPPYQGGGDMIESVSLLESTFQSGSLRFEAGTPPIAEVLGLKSAIDFLEKWGREDINSYETHLLHYTTSKLLEIPGIQILGTTPEKGPLITFLLDGVHPLDLATLLDAHRFAIRTGHLCAKPTMDFFGCTAAARISFGLYNTVEEIDIFIETLKKILPLLSPLRQKKPPT